MAEKMMVNDVGSGKMGHHFKIILEIGNIASSTAIFRWFLSLKLRAERLEKNQHVEM